MCRSRGTGDLGYDITAFDMAVGIEPMSILCLGENVEKNISRVGTRRMAIGSSQGLVNKGFLMCRRWGDWISGRRRALHHLYFT